MEQPAPRPSQPEPTAYRFGGYTFDPARGVLRDPQGSEAGLRPKTAEVLRCLADRAGRVASREELMQAVWPDVIVTDDSLTQCIFEIRRALGDAGAGLLRTLPKRGYLLAAEVTRAEAPASPATTISRDTAAISPPPAPDREEAQSPAPGVITQLSGPRIASVKVVEFAWVGEAAIGGQAALGGSRVGASSVGGISISAMASTCM